MNVKVSQKNVFGGGLKHLRSPNDDSACVVYHGHFFAGIFAESFGPFHFSGIPLPIKISVAL